MKLTTKLKLFFSRKLRDRLSCAGCELPCGGTHKIRKAEICDIMIYNYEHKEKTNVKD